ncbi:Glycosyl transferase domain containing protein [Aphelenchoides fujianensis]|nr:Glycosyl transferase domain containing protein [Aphelenchoides fujianensis]
MVEAYHSITHKVRAWVQWANERHPTVRFVFKMDDDVQLQVGSLLRMLEFFDHQQRLVLCRVFPDGQITRNPDSKWFLSKFEYAASHLGTFCQGMSYAFSGDLLKKMAENIPRVQYLFMDDWYATHALLNATAAIYVDVGRHFVSADGSEEIARLLANGTRNEPIFGHFRSSSERIPLEKRIDLWKKIRERSCGVK